MTYLVASDKIIILNESTFKRYRFLLISLIFGMANDLKFGPTACRVSNESVAEDYAALKNVSAREFCAENDRYMHRSLNYAIPDNYKWRDQDLKSWGARRGQRLIMGGQTCARISEREARADFLELLESDFFWANMCAERT